MHLLNLGVSDYLDIVMVHSARGHSMMTLAIDGREVGVVLIVEEGDHIGDDRWIIVW